jgi:hypothetical protein
MSDPVEEDTFPVDGILMSNFVHPSWFEPFKHPSGTKFDHLGLLTKPFSMTKGGYMIISPAKRGTESTRPNLRTERESGASFCRDSAACPWSSAENRVNWGTPHAMGNRPH